MYTPEEWRRQHECNPSDDERVFPKYAICSLGRLGRVETLSSHPFYEDREPNWAYKGFKVFSTVGEDTRWMSHAASARFLSRADCDRLDDILEKAWMYDDLCE